jgi:hypothetical protein
MAHAAVARALDEPGDGRWLDAALHLWDDAADAGRDPISQVADPNWFSRPRLTPEVDPTLPLTPASGVPKEVSKGRASCRAAAGRVAGKTKSRGLPQKRKRPSKESFKDACWLCGWTTERGGTSSLREHCTRHHRGAWARHPSRKERLSLGTIKRTTAPTKAVPPSSIRHGGGASRPGRSRVSPRTDRVRTPPPTKAAPRPEESETPSDRVREILAATNGAVVPVDFDRARRIESILLNRFTDGRAPDGVLDPSEKTDLFALDGSGLLDHEFLGGRPGRKPSHYWVWRGAQPLGPAPPAREREAD